MTDSEDRLWVRDIEGRPIAKCLVNNVPPGYFYPDEGSGANTQEARKFCNGEDYGEECPVKWQCLHFALSQKIRDGVWGGFGEKDRRPLARRFRKASHPSVEELKDIVTGRKPAGEYTRSKSKRAGSDTPASKRVKPQVVVPKAVVLPNKRKRKQV